MLGLHSAICYVVLNYLDIYFLSHSEVHVLLHLYIL